LRVPEDGQHQPSCRSALHPSHSCGHFRTFQSIHRRFYETELYPHTEHTCGDESVLPAHLLHTKSIWQNAVPLWCNLQVSQPSSPQCDHSHTKLQGQSTCPTD
jgi:hypothetical protein